MGKAELEKLIKNIRNVSCTGVLCNDCPLKTRMTCFDEKCGLIALRKVLDNMDIQ